MEVFQPENSPFKIIYADVTHRCQMSCANCYLPNRDLPDMDIKKLYACLERLPRKTDIRLIGGEPTLRKDLPEIIKEIVHLGHRPVLITNGLKLADREYVRSLIAAGLKYSQISFNGFKYDEIYKVSDQMACAAKKMQAVENCITEGLRFSLSCILVRDLNERLVSELIDFAETLPKPARINFRNVGSIGRNTNTSKAPLGLGEIVGLVAEKTKISSDEIFSHKLFDNQIRLGIRPELKFSQQIMVKITDWTIFNQPTLIDPKSGVRGRVTQDYELAPHFEHVKENEFGY